MDFCAERITHLWWKFCLRFWWLKIGEAEFWWSRTRWSSNMCTILATAAVLTHHNVDDGNNSNIGTAQWQRWQRWHGTMAMSALTATMLMASESTRSNKWFSGPAIRIAFIDQWKWWFLKWCLQIRIVCRYCAGMADGTNVVRVPHWERHSANRSRNPTPHFLKKKKVVKVPQIGEGPAFQATFRKSL